MSSAIQRAKLLPAVSVAEVPEALPIAMGASTRPIAATIAPVTTGGIKPLHPAVPGDVHHEADQGVEGARRDDPAERERDVRVRAARRSRGRDQHRPDEGEARAEIARHLAANDDEEQQRRKP